MQDKIQEQIKEAMRAKDQTRVITLRGVIAAFTNELVSLKRKPQDSLSEAEAITVIKRLVKQRKDSIEQFENGGRQDLADNEKAELTILEEFLPAQLSEEKARKIAEKVLAQNPEEKNQNKLTGLVMKECAGNADGSVVKKIVEDLLK